MRNATEILFVLDESGSMSSLQMDTITKFNNFISEERSKNGECRISILKFDDPTNIKYIRRTEDLRLVKLLTDDEYRPTGSTALYDAIGQGMDELGARFTSMREADRPDKVVVVVITDGCENTSVKWTLGKLKVAIHEQENTYNWKFLFLGKGLDVAEQGLNMGVKLAGAASYGRKKEHYRAGMEAMLSNLGDYRQTGNRMDLYFKAAQRSAMEDSLVAQPAEATASNPVK